MHKYLLVFFAFLGCSQPIDLPNFDEAKWKDDPRGCKNERATMVSNLLENKKQIRGLDQREVLQILGAPDEHELSKRRQKFFVYYLAAGPSCQGDNTQSLDSIPKAIIRFDALGEANEINVYN